MKDMKKTTIHFEKPTLVWLGDPCYAPVLNKDEVWDEFCDILFSKEDSNGRSPSHVFEHEGTEFVFGNTAHGDGCYAVKGATTTLGVCGVDAGLLSVIPAGAFGLDANSGDNYGGVFTTVEGDCHMDEEGTLHAGVLTIKTDWDDEDDEDDYWDDEEDEEEDY